MGLDNGVICRISSEKYDFTIKYEICYWRKYWGLRDDILKAIGVSFESPFPTDINLTSDMINELYDVFDYYAQDFKRVKSREDSLSTIWSFAEEYKNMLNSRDMFFCIKEFINGNITLQEFIDITYTEDATCSPPIREDVCDIFIEFRNKPKEKESIFMCEDNSDIQVSFEFYDSY